MTRLMYDSVDVGAIPGDAGAVAGYVDGRYDTWGALCKRFPHANKLSLTVFGDVSSAGADCEPGNIDAAQTAAWVADKLHVDPHGRPVVYASRDLVMSGGRRYGIPAVLDELRARGISRARVRVLSAHYGRGAHICSAVSCGAGFTADGTQWTDKARGLNLDESLISDTFFPVAPAHQPRRRRLPRPRRPHPKVTGATSGGGLAVALVAVLHAAGVHITPAESSAIAAILAAIAGWATPARLKEQKA